MHERQRRLCKGCISLQDDESGPSNYYIWYSCASFLVSWGCWNTRNITSVTHSNKRYFLRIDSFWKKPSPLNILHTAQIFLFVNSTFWRKTFDDNDFIEMKNYKIWPRCGSVSYLFLSTRLDLIVSSLYFHRRLVQREQEENIIYMLKSNMSI